MLSQTYYVTKTPETDGTHFVHSDKCQVLPDLAMEELGQHESCEGAVEKAKALYAPLNACALCCSKCYVMDGGTVA